MRPAGGDRGTVEVVCRPALAAGFGLAGLQAQGVADGAGAAVKVGELLADPALRPAVLLLEDALQEALPPALRRRLQRETATLVVPFPSPAAAPVAGEAARHLLELLRQAIGYRVRL